jgi:arylsulfatase
MLELDWAVGRIMDTIRAKEPNTLVIFTPDKGARQDAWPDAGSHPRRSRRTAPPGGCSEE